MIAIRGARLVDGTGRDPVDGGVVLVDGDRIVDVGPGLSADETIDLDGCTLLPGLIDAHVHLAASSDISAIVHNELSVAERAADIFRATRDALHEGFTLVRDCGGIDAGLVRAVSRGLVPGPRIVCCGPLLTQCGGHGHFSPPWAPIEAWEAQGIPGLTQFSIVCDGVDAVRAGAREAFRRGGSFLKMCVTGGVVSTTDDLEDTQFTVPELRAAVEEAAARRTYVTVHAHNDEGVRMAVEAGVRCIEHGTSVDAEAAELLAARGVALVPTLASSHLLATRFEETGLPEPVRARVEGVGQGMANAAKAALDAGVLLGSGSDYLGPVQSPRGLEITLKAAAVGAMPALVSATSANARILGVADRLGSLAPGKLADVVAIEGDPLQDPGLFAQPERVAFVMKAGEVVRSTRG